ncbi:NnrS family protein [Marinimicrococcus flavescens]|uniref:NnrS family protein n=1 Tax=Marinimicrococcus flavescens TaxID=3031815 RepID=A0AAP4D5W0_9PROT|nr:NnrS family protein [Marinimicrococcus flavescens]
MREPAGLARIPLLGYGFRPFFLGAALWAVAAMALWIGALTGSVERLDRFGALSWHVHEFLFGYVAAVMAGFLLTAIPSWTGRPPVRGGLLLTLLAAWLAGRLALLSGEALGPLQAAAIDSLFLVLLAAVVAREIMAAGNRRNLKVALLVSALALANILFHAELIATGAADLALRGGIALVVGLIMLIGGRIVPAFTRNWLAGRHATLLPAAFDRLDAASLAVAAAALVAWVALPDAALTGLALCAAGVLQGVRLSRWRGRDTWREPLLLVLHLGYAFVPLGFLLVGAGQLTGIVLPTAALHAWTAGAMGVMTLAVMTRASLGHCGRALTASIPTRGIFVAIIIAALLRVLASLAPAAGSLLVELSAVAWLAAFAGFLAAYGPMLMRRRAA